MDIKRPSISVILSASAGRYAALDNTLKSWQRVTYPNMDFTLIINDNGDQAPLLHAVFESRYPFINRVLSHPVEALNRVWRREGMQSRGEYVVFAMADEVLGDYDLLDQMIAIPKERARFSVNTFFLNKANTEQLTSIDWLSNPASIEKLPEFWNYLEYDNRPNSSRFDAKLLTHITGAYRTYWNWVGWFRNDEHGYLNLDRDLYVREVVLQTDVISPRTPCCYHQYHIPQTFTSEERLPGYFYENEMQARLLEPAQMEAH